MSDWFKNSASEIPDEMWRAPAPMQRQADAVVMWAELTGKHAAAGQEEDLSFSEKAYVNAYPMGTKSSRSGAVRKHRALRRKAELTGKHASLAEIVGIAQAREGLKEMSSRGPREDGLPGSVSANEIRLRMADQKSLHKVTNPRLYGTIGAIGGGLYGAHQLRTPLGALAGAGAGAAGAAVGSLGGRALGNAITRPMLAQALRDKEAAFKPGAQKAIRMAGDNLELTGKHASYAKSTAMRAALGGVAGGGAAAAGSSKKERKKNALRGAAAGAAVGAAAGRVGKRVRVSLADKVVGQMTPGPRPGTFYLPAGVIDEFRAKSKLVRGLTGAGAVGGGALAGRVTGKHASFDGVRAFGQNLALDPRSDDLEKAFKHYEKKTGNSRNRMSHRDIHNSLLATGMGKSAAFKPGVQKAIRMAGDNIELTGAAIGAPVGGLKAYTENRKGRGGISNAEATVLGEIAKARAQKADKKKVAKLRQKLQTAKSRRENIGATTAKGVGIGTVTGALGAYALKRSRKSRSK